MTIRDNAQDAQEDRESHDNGDGEEDEFLQDAMIDGDHVGRNQRDFDLYADMMSGDEDDEEPPQERDGLQGQQDVDMTDDFDELHEFRRRVGAPTTKKVTEMI